MKNFKKLFALLITLVMVLGMSTNVFAASITITRDSSYNGTEEESGRTYKYYKVFSASYSSNLDQGFEGGHDDGEPNTDQEDGNVSYTATATVAGMLNHTGNRWFDVQEISGSTNKSVTWKDGVEANAENVQAAAAWLIENGAYEAGPTPMEFENGNWESGEIDPGYYVVVGDTGKNLIAVTSDIEILEKNTYPPQDKTQADEDNPTQRDTDVDVAIGDVITYQAKITIPSTAKVGETIIVTDTPSKGLDYNDDVCVKVNDGNAGVDITKHADAWQAVITVTQESLGKAVIFEYTMTINEEALTDTRRENCLDLNYGDSYTSVTEKVNYTTYFTGIEKVDGGNAETKLEGVKFTLKEDGDEFKVTKDGNYYVPDVNGSSEVVTDANGLIQIRGLDSDKTYTLTEKETLPGYNLLKEDVTLKLVEDTGNAFDGHDADTYDDVENNKGSLLPSTGSIGTTIFYVIGGAMVVVAGLSLIHI